MIDGLQRISSYLHLRGELEAGHLDPPVTIGNFLVLSDCDIVTELNGHTFLSLSTALQIKLKRAFVRVEVVRKGSDPKFKYHMFKRLNTGGETLTHQQLRNCTIRLLNSTFNDFIIELSRNEDFKKCTKNLTQEQRLGAFDQELVLRFFALKNYKSEFIHDVADFLTDYMEKVSDPDVVMNFDYASEKRIFEKTFHILANTLGDKAFGLANKNKTGITKAVGVYQYEAFTIGIQSKLNDINISTDELKSQVTAQFEQIKFDDEFVKIITGGGKNSKGPLNERIQFVENKVSEFLS